jgi:hypothetical protein
MVTKNVRVCVYFIEHQQNYSLTQYYHKKIISVN